MLAPVVTLVNVMIEPLLRVQGSWTFGHNLDVSWNCLKNNVKYTEVRLQRGITPEIALAWPFFPYCLKTKSMQH